MSSSYAKQEPRSANDKEGNGGVDESSGSEEETGGEDESEVARSGSLSAAYPQAWSNEWSYLPAQAPTNLPGSAILPCTHQIDRSILGNSQLCYTSHSSTADRSYSYPLVSYPLSPTAICSSDSSSFSNSYASSGTSSGPEVYAPYPSHAYYYPFPHVGTMDAFVSPPSVSGSANYPPIGFGLDAGAMGAMAVSSSQNNFENDSSYDSTSMLVGQARQQPAASLPRQGHANAGGEVGPSSGNRWPQTSNTLRDRKRFHPYGKSAFQSMASTCTLQPERTPFGALENHVSFKQRVKDQQPDITSGEPSNPATTSLNTSAPPETNKTTAPVPQLFISRLNEIDASGAVRSATSGKPVAPITIDELLCFVKGNVSSPIIEYLCELLANPDQYSHIVSWTQGGLRWEFKIHNTKTFADILNLRFGKPKSYLQIARALKSFEQKEFHGRVTLKKVKDKRNHFQFFPIGRVAP